MTWLLDNALAIASAVVATVAVFLAGRANGISRSALQIESRAEERAREFRDVDWYVNYVPKGSGALYTLKNIGSTDVVDAIFVYEIDGVRRAIQVGDIPRSGGEGLVEVPGLAHNQAGGVLPVQFKLHWTSPHGHPDTFEWAPIQIF